MSLLLGENEKCSFESLRYSEVSPIFLTCDHASNTIPESLNNLGLTENILRSHRGWDIGALQVSRYISTKLKATLCYTTYSRLVIDCNRPLTVDDSIPKSVDGVIIPGNSDIAVADREQRIAEIFEPYHNQIGKLLKEQLIQYSDTAYLAVHSFTPTMNGKIRPWDIGVTFHNQSRFSEFVLHSLKEYEDLNIGVNEPYPITPEGDYGITEHGEKNGLDSMLIEIRQDRIDIPSRQMYIAQILTDILWRYIGQSGY